MAAPRWYPASAIINSWKFSSPPSPRIKGKRFWIFRSRFAVFLEIKREKVLYLKSSRICMHINRWWFLNKYRSSREIQGSSFNVAGAQGTSGPTEGDGPSSVGPMGPVGTLGPLPGRGGATIRRGPGRPRLRPTGPGHQGYRNPGHHNGRKVQRPLPVPLRSQQTIATVNQSQKSSVQRASGSGPSISSSSMGSSGSFSSSASESRPFGFYTQQQQQQQSRGSS